MADPPWKIPERDRQIIDAFKKAGPRSASYKSSIEDVVSSVPGSAFTTKEVTNAILFILLAQPSQHYNLNEFIAALSASPKCGQLDWNHVVAALDMPDLRIKSEQFSRLFHALLRVAETDNGFDIQRLWGGRWTHPKTQLSFLRGYSELKEVTASIVPRYDYAFNTAAFSDASVQIQHLIKLQSQSNLNNKAAITAVFEVSLSSEETALSDDAGIVLAKVENDFLLGFLLSITNFGNVNAWTATQERFIEQCFRLYLNKERKDSDVALSALFHQNRALLQQLCMSTFHVDPRFTELIYHRARELGWLDFLLDHITNPLTLDIVCLMQKEDSSFDMEAWLTRASQPLDTSSRMNFGNILWKFLRIKADDEYRLQKNGTPHQSLPLSLHAVHALLSKIQELLDGEQLQAAQVTCFTTFPRLVNYSTDPEIDTILDRLAAESNTIPKDVDSRMSELYGSMYRGDITLRQMVGELRLWRVSRSPAMQDLFCAMVHGLLDEYTCYVEYPREALEKTALLFGNILRFHLLPPVPEDYALRLIVEAVRTNLPGETMHAFGVEVLMQMGDTLSRHKNTCAAILAIETLQDEEIRQRAQEGLNAADDGLLTNGDHITNGVDEHAEPESRDFTSINAEMPPEDAGYSEPGKEEQEKILFVINNLSKDNLTQKLAELKDVLQPKFFQWFAAYLVEQRARLEPNNQDMYFDFISHTEDVQLYDEVLRETFVSISKSICARSTAEVSLEKTYLKSLGSWLGSLTLARDKPIKVRNIDFFSLLLEAYETQRLSVVLPFSCKVLVQAARSLVFQPPNPWILDLLAIMMELYYIGELKLNLKFEIEVLCKDLGLDHKRIEASTYIREMQTEQPPVEDVMTNASVHDHFEDYSELALRNGRLREQFSVAEIMSSLPRYEEVLRYPPTSGSAIDQLHTKEVINSAVDRAIQEIIAPVVERSITIASLSTHQLVTKDYATEADPEHYRSAAHNMVRSLAGSLALVTCKEPLRMSITNYIRQNLEEMVGGFMPEGTILMTVNDNLDIAAGLVKGAAEMRAIPEMDNVINNDIEERRQFALEHPGEEFSREPINRWGQWLPDPYKLDGNGLNEAMRSIYEEFEPRVNGLNLGHAQNVSTDSTIRNLPDILNEPLSMPMSTPAGQPILPHQDLMMTHDSRSASVMPQHRVNGIHSIPPQIRIADLVEEVQKATRTSSVIKMKDIDKDTTLFQDIRSILMIFATLSPPTLDYVARQVAEKLTLIVLEQPPQCALEAEFLTFLLMKLCDVSEGIVRDVNRWVSNREEQLVQNPWTVAAFAIAGLMETSHIDSTIAGALRSHNETALQLLKELLDQTLLGEEPTLLRADFIDSIVAVYDWLKEEPDHAVLRDLTEKLKAHGIPEYVSSALSDKVRARDDQLHYIFREWSRMCDKISAVGSAQLAFLHELNRSELLTSAEDLVTFLRLSVEASINSFILESQSYRGSLAAAFSNIDALATMIVLLVKYQGNLNGTVKQGKAAYLESVLSLAVLVVNDQIERKGINFNQRIFTRLFSTILHSYNELNMQELPDHVDMMLSFSKTFQTMQPVVLPSFSCGWLSLVSHRVFISGMLDQGNPYCEDRYRHLLGLMIEYLAPLAENQTLQGMGETLSRGVYRNLYVLQHDYPDFISNNHTYLCARVPLRQPQLRNLILSAYPVDTIEPDPATVNLKALSPADMKSKPLVPSDNAVILEAAKCLDVFLAGMKKIPDQDAAIKAILEAVSHARVDGATFTTPCRDAEILGSLAILYIDEALALNSTFDAKSASTILLTRLLEALPYAQKYGLLLCLFDQLRAPNAHTEYTIKLLLHIWGSGPRGDDTRSYDREVMVRILRERIDFLHPIPWGSVVLFRELSENAEHGFWESGAFVGQPELRDRLMQAIRTH